jgi:NAD(P)-dependent dehydrogenase (short-subunit alcohol dehydrogenase family)
VTGGASGIGAEVARRLRDAGRTVVTWDRERGADVHCDVADPVAVGAALAATVAEHGTPTQWTLSAGVGSSGLLIDADGTEWDRVLGVNAKGLWLTMQAAARAMRDASTGGSIVAVTSVSARLADRTMGFYCASKAAADMLVRVAAQEWAPLGIRVNAVAPGLTRTPMLGPEEAGGWVAGPVSRTPLGRVGESGDIAAAVLALHGLDWVVGEVLTADGGLALHSPIDPLGAGRQPRS